MQLPGPDRSFSRPGALAILAGVLLAQTALAADVTYDRLVNPEPQNWLTVHHDYGAQRFSPLAIINKGNAKNLKLAFAVGVGGSSNNESLEAPPLVEDGFMYMVDSWGIVSKIDVRSGTAGPILWQMNPKLERQDRNRGVALWNNLVISVTGYAGRVIATNKETGAVVWDKNLLDQADLELTAAPLALKDVVLIGGSGGDRGLRNWLAALDPKTGENKMEDLLDPGPRRAGQRDLEESGVVADRRRRVLRHRRLRSGPQPHLLGNRKPGAGIRRHLPPRR